MDSGTGEEDAGETDSGSGDEDSGPPPAEDPLICVEECVTNADCFVGTSDVGFECLGGRCRPTDCDDNLDCVAELSASAPLFTRECTGDSDCVFFLGRFQATCVEVGTKDDGTTRQLCASTPATWESAGLPPGSCPGAWELLTLPRPGGGSTVDVCALHDARCTRGACENPCADDNECLLVRNNWTYPCASDADCQEGADSNAERRCILLGTKSVCAQPAVPMGTAPERAPPCDAQNIEVELIGGGTFVACGFAMMCDPETEACVSRCLNDLNCADPTPICNRTTGECECGEDADCASVPGHPVCIDGACNCSEDGHCADFPNGDVCANGACGCSGAPACTESRVHDGTIYQCVEPSEI